MLQDRLTDIVAVEPVTCPGMGGREGGTVGPVEESLEQCRGSGAGLGRALAGAFQQDGMDLVPYPAVDQGLVLAGIARVLVYGFTEVGPVVEHPVEEVLGDRVSTWRPESLLRNLSGQDRGGSDLDEIS